MKSTLTIQKRKRKNEKHTSCTPLHQDYKIYIEQERREKTKEKKWKR